MANRSNFVKIVICVSFLDAYIIFLRAPSINRQKHITQLERNFAQLERNLKSSTLCKTYQKITSKIVYFFETRPLFL